ncbi:MAG: hypothetical protein IPL72_00790 [Sulfuritalea sp.]|nr:hypothetical protein [Sulfuritalea sp.]
MTMKVSATAHGEGDEHAGEQAMNFARPKRMPSASCSFFVLAMLIVMLVTDLYQELQRSRLIPSAIDR